MMLRVCPFSMTLTTQSRPISDTAIVLLLIWYPHPPPGLGLLKLGWIFPRVYLLYIRQVTTDHLPFRPSHAYVDVLDGFHV